MRIFFLTFVAIYGGMHIYALMRIRLLLVSRRSRFLANAFCMLMVAAPLLVRIAEQVNLQDAAVVIAWLGYGWMGYIFLLVAILAMMDILIFAWRAMARMGSAGGAPLSGEFLRKRSVMALLLALCCTLYGGYEALQIRTEHIVIRSPKISSTAGIRVVQLSDVHLGVMIGRWRLQRMLQAAAAARPDIVVSTGDMVDGQIHRLNGLSEMFAGISPRYGMYAVLGNHEYYAGLQNSLDFLRRAGFRVLRKEQAEIAECLTIAGVDDPAGARWGDTGGSDEKGLLVSPAMRRFTILLKHRPAVNPESRGRFDLQLSGHVHKGQIFPFNLLTWFFFPVSAGLNQLDDGSRLYVSRGTGTWGPPIRFLAPPEVAVIDLLPSASP
jgi:predicted MPP superfamily phosphohydrolase